MGNNIPNLNSFEVNPLGPGHYSPNLNSIKPIKNTIIGKSRREAIVSQNSTPGPGSYNLLDIKESPQCSFSKEIRGRMNIPDYPAPGEYNSYGLSDNIKYNQGKTILPRRPIIINSIDSPGPGSYDIKSASVTPIFSLGKSKRSEMMNSLNPGPGQYSPSIFQSKSPGITIGKGKRSLIIEKNYSPGPGTYDNKSYITYGPKFSLSGKIAEKKRNESPGPGQYTPDFKIMKPDSIHATIGNAERLYDKGVQYVPGPGTYQINDTSNSPQWTFNKDINQI